MKVILDMVISPNGFMARENGDEDWLPHEGWDEFVAEAKQYDNIVMGREAYEQVTQKYKDNNFDDVPVAHKIIITTDKAFRTPSGYQVLHSPEEAVDYLQRAGLKTLFLIGGGKLNAAFAKHNLIDRIQLTITPYVIGKGRPFLAFDDYELKLILHSVEQRSLGRVRLIYRVNNLSN